MHSQPSAAKDDGALSFTFASGTGENGTEQSAIEDNERWIMRCKFTSIGPLIRSGCRMGALGMTLDDGSVLEVNFEGGLTILSLIFPVLGVFIGLRIASEDPFFLEMEQSRRKEILAQDLQKMTQRIAHQLLIPRTPGTHFLA
ncbi:hypothetical protein FI667_g10163, partial [Globisporangium splendens]